MPRPFPPTGTNATWRRFSRAAGMRRSTPRPMQVQVSLPVAGVESGLESNLGQETSFGEDV